MDFGFSRLWFSELFLAMLAIALIAVPVQKYRLANRITWYGALWALASYVLRISLSMGHLWLWKGIVDYQAAQTRRSGIAVLPDNWGAALPPEQRTLYTKMMAEHNYTRWGETVEYIELDGTRKTYVPDDRARSLRNAEIAFERNADESRMALLAFGLSWLVVPLAGVAFPFFPGTQRILRFATIEIRRRNR